MKKENYFSVRCLFSHTSLYLIFGRVSKSIKIFLLFFLAASQNAFPQSYYDTQISVNALHFDGVDDYVSIGYVNYFLTSDFTLQAWIRDEATPGGISEEVILSDQPTSSANGFRMEILNGILTTFIGGNAYSTGGIDLRDNTCHHVAVRSQGGTIQHFLDGNLFGPAISASGSVSMTDPILIGIRRSAAGLTGSFKGLIKEVMVWAQARTQSEIQSDKNRVPYPESNLPPGYWRFQDGSGQVASGFGNVSPAGTLGASTAIEAADPVWTVGCPSCYPNYGSITTASPLICSGGSVTLNAITQSGLTYQWRLNGVAISGATASSYVTNVTGNYTCTVSGSCGTVTSNTIAVTPGSVPTAVISASGATTFCQGSSVTLNANAGPNSYQWRKNAVSISGATVATYIASATGNYTCVVSNGCGSNASNTISVTVNTIPVQPGTITGPSSVCKRQNNVVYTIAPVNGATSYTWTLPSQAKFNSGQGTTSINVKFGNNTGYITVKASNNCGISQLRTLAITMPCRETEEYEADVVVFPNPSSEEFNLRISGDENTVVLFIRDMTGKEVERRENITEGDEIKFGSDLVPGIYFAFLVRSSDTRIIPLVKGN